MNKHDFLDETFKLLIETRQDQWYKCSNKCDHHFHQLIHCKNIRQKSPLLHGRASTRGYITDQQNGFFNDNRRRVPSL